jgi:outer membrane protein TolC
MPATKAETGAVQALTLMDCVQMALNQQPALAAYRASVAAAEAQQAALENLHLAGLINHAMCIRKQQAALGVVIAHAGVSQGEWETRYAVTRNFYSVRYAQAQQQVAADVIAALGGTRSTAKNYVDVKKSKVVTSNQVDQITTYLRLAEARTLEADLGIERAKAALREAMGVGCDFNLQIAPEDLPIYHFDLCLGDIVSLAISRRGEMVQVANVAQVTALEVDAQGKTCMPTARTFASFADIHARPIPPGEHDGTYRPDALGLEMPANLAGKRKDRMARASAFHGRAQAVVDKTHNLIVLEAENAFYKWQEAAAKIPKTKAAKDKASKLEKDTSHDFTSDQKVPVKEVLDAIVLMARARMLYNEAVYQQLLALADLQRITAGGFLLP